MKGYGQHYRNPWLLVLLLILGGIVGSFIGQALGNVQHLAFLNQGIYLGLPDTKLNLDILALTFGFVFKVNWIGLLGFIVALIVYERL